jgi:hypothetical protein
MNVIYLLNNNEDIYIKTKRNMRVNVNHPSFITFLESVTDSILSNITVENYFQLTTEKKLNIQYLVLKLMKSAVKVRAKLEDSDLQSFILVLCRKNEESENYELSALLFDIYKNFESVNTVTGSNRTLTVKTKIEKNSNGNTPE